MAIGVIGGTGYSLSNVDYHGKELVQPVRVFDVVTGIGKLELSREWDSVEELGVTSEILLVFESLQVESKYIRQPLDLHPSPTCQLSAPGIYETGLTSSQPPVDRSRSRRRTCSSDKAFHLRRIAADKK